MFRPHLLQSILAPVLRCHVFNHGDRRLRISLSIAQQRDPEIHPQHRAVFAQLPARQPQIVLLGAQQASELRPHLSPFFGMLQGHESAVQQLRRRVAGHLAVRGVRIPDATFEIEHDHADGHPLDRFMKQRGGRDPTIHHLSEYRRQLLQTNLPVAPPEMNESGGHC